MNYDAPLYSAADVAGVIDEPEATVRRWHHAGFASYLGRKSGYSVLYTTRDIAGFAVARDLVRLNFPPPLAAKIGAVLTWRNPPEHAVLEGSPDELALIAPPAESGIMQDRMQWRVPGSTRSTISVPVGRIFADVVERASRIRHARASR